MNLVDAVHRLGPFGCLSFDVQRDSDEFNELCNYVNLEMIKQGELLSQRINQLNCKLNAFRKSIDTYNVNVVKTSDGVLGYY